MTYTIQVKEIDGGTRIWTRPYIQAYNDWKNDGVQLPDDVLASEQIEAYNKQNTFNSIEEAQAALDWYTNYVRTADSHTLNEFPKLRKHYSNQENFKIINTEAEAKPLTCHCGCGETDLMNHHPTDNLDSRQPRKSLED
jgi:hypothetical protein